MAPRPGWRGGRHPPIHLQKSVRMARKDVSSEVICVRCGQEKPEWESREISVFLPVIKGGRRELPPLRLCRPGEKACVARPSVYRAIPDVIPTGQAKGRYP